MEKQNGQEPEKLLLYVSSENYSKEAGGEGSGYDPEVAGFTVPPAPASEAEEAENFTRAVAPPLGKIDGDRISSPSPLSGGEEKGEENYSKEAGGEGSGYEPEVAGFTVPPAPASGGEKKGEESDSSPPPSGGEEKGEENPSPPPSEGELGVSGLPGDVWGVILSKLAKVDIAAAVRTSCLSRDWRYVWRYMNVDIQRLDLELNLQSVTRFQVTTQVIEPRRFNELFLVSGDQVSYGIIGAAIGRFRFLHVLSLSGIAFQGGNPFAHLPALKRLILHNCRSSSLFAVTGQEVLEIEIDNAVALNLESIMAPKLTYFHLEGDLPELEVTFSLPAVDRAQIRLQARVGNWPVFRRTFEGLMKSLRNASSLFIRFDYVIDKDVRIDFVQTLQRYVTQVFIGGVAGQVRLHHLRIQTRHQNSHVYRTREYHLQADEWIEEESD